MSNNVVLKGVFADILANFALMFGDEAGKDEILNCDPVEPVCGRIKFNGDHEGELSVAAPTAFCLEIAANVIGIEEEDTAAVINEYDALKEFINLAAGHIVTEKFGNKTNCLIMPPEVMPIDSSEWKKIGNNTDVFFMIDDMPVIVSLVIKGE